VSIILHCIQLLDDAKRLFFAGDFNNGLFGAVGDAALVGDPFSGVGVDARRPGALLQQERRSVRSACILITSLGLASAGGARGPNWAPDKDKCDSLP